MLKRLFLSIIILSALTSEGGNYYTANLIDYYLMNLPSLDIVQDSRAVAVPYFGDQNLSGKKGTPVSFFKKLSQDTINSKTPNTNNSSNYGFFPVLFVALIIFVTISSLFNRKVLINKKYTLLCRSDSSPPAYC